MISKGHFDVKFIYIIKSLLLWIYEVYEVYYKHEKNVKFLL